MYAQLQANHKVEACFWQPGEQTGIMMRVAGEVEFVDDPDLKKKVLEDRPFLKEFGMTFDHPGLIIFRICPWRSLLLDNGNQLRTQKVDQIRRIKINFTINC